jgi:uncharacterized membrane protein
MQNAATATFKSPALKATPDAASLSRLCSIDIFRGLLMLWMALDHTRDFFTNIPFEPEALAEANLPLFATRSSNSTGTPDH